jgi:predicted Zn-dependent protease
MKCLERVLCAFLFLALSCPVCAQPEDLAAKSKRGKELIDAGKFEEAIPVYAELVQAMPGNPAFVMNLGLALHMAGRERKAIEQFEGVLRLDPSYLPARLFLGEAYLTLGEPIKVIEQLETVVQAQPDNRDAREMLAEAFFLFGRMEPAAQNFRRVTELAPENPRAWDGLRRSYEALAVQAREALKEVAPDSAYGLALEAESRVTFDSAFYLYRQALARMPTIRGVHQAVAEIYRKTGHPDWATLEEEKELKLPPLRCQDADASASTAGRKLECQFLAGQFEEAVASGKDIHTSDSYYWQARACNALALGAYTHLINMEPSAQLRQVMAKIYLERRLYKQSAQEWQEALKFSPRDPRIQKGLAAALSLNKDYAAARAILEDLVRREPDSAELNYMLGDTLLNSEQPGESISYLKRAVEIDPELLPAQKALAHAYLQTGKSEQAIPHLRAALPSDDDGSLYYQLAQAYRSAGQQDRAEEMLRKFQEVRNSARARAQSLPQKTEITPP